MFQAPRSASPMILFRNSWLWWPIRNVSRSNGLVFLVVSAGAALGQRSGKQTDAILAADAAWLKVYQAKDLAKSVAFCDEQASMLAPNAPIATGKDAIAKVIADGFAHDNITWRANKVEVSRSGDLGYTSGTTENTFKDASGKTAAFKGKYLTVWKKRPTVRGRCCTTCSNPICRRFPNLPSAILRRFERGERFGWFAGYTFLAEWLEQILIFG